MLKIMLNRKYPHGGINAILILCLCAAVAASALLPRPAGAEIFRWQDEQGYWHFSEGPDPRPQNPQPNPAPPDLESPQNAPQAAPGAPPVQSSRAVMLGGVLFEKRS